MTLTIEELLASHTVRRLAINTFTAMKLYYLADKWDEHTLREWCEIRGDRLADHYIYGNLTMAELESCLDLAFHPQQSQHLSPRNSYVGHV